jgi:hypothetical protein
VPRVRLSSRKVARSNVPRLAFTGNPGYGAPEFVEGKDLKTSSCADSLALRYRYPQGLDTTDDYYHYGLLSLSLENKYIG